MKGRRILKSVAKIAFSTIGAIFIYVLWLVVFLLLSEYDIQIITIVLWLLSPIVTAAGFTFGYAVGQRLAEPPSTNLLRTYIWPLIGCVIGALIVVWSGPMLIIFGMFFFGTVGIILCEISRQS